MIWARPVYWIPSAVCRRQKHAQTGKPKPEAEIEEIDEFDEETGASAHDQSPDDRGKIS